MAVRILIGDVRERLAELPDESVHCVVTSPPYYGLRDYNVPGQIGLEPTLAEYIDTMTAVFRDVRRVLRSDGVCWLNIGDSYAANGVKQTGRNDENPTDLARRFETFGTGRPKASTERDDRQRIIVDTGLKPKDLMMVPARLALALQADGWWLRSDIIWHKPNPMPESMRDRPTSAHEHIFLLTKSARYWYDADAVAERTTGHDQGTLGEHEGNKYAAIKNIASSTLKQNGPHRNLRNVWAISTVGFPGAHFATFPPEIPRRCIKAGCPEGGVVLDPFFGAGTTGLVADQLGRDCIGIELNESYALMSQVRIQESSPMLAHVTIEGSTPPTNRAVQT